VRPLTAYRLTNVEFSRFCLTRANLVNARLPDFGRGGRSKEKRLRFAASYELPYRAKKERRRDLLR
jgi:hypothetical protein